MFPTIVTIDGPAGSGKSTVARRLAHQLGFTFLDTGAIYRTVGAAALARGVGLDDGPGCAAIACEIEMLPGEPGEPQRVLVRGEDLGDKIRTPEASMAASTVSAHPEVRAALLDLQRRFAGGYSLVAEGRDTGSVVFPDAQTKFFLTASDEVRAMRRFMELEAKGTGQSYEEVLAEMIRRDKQDSGRAVAPLTIPVDGVVVDTSPMSIEQVVKHMLEVVDERR